VVREGIKRESSALPVYSSLEEVGVMLSKKSLW